MLSSETDLRACCLLGGPATGKTAAIAKRALGLGTTGQRVLVVCAAPVGKEQMGKLLVGCPSNVELVTARELALEVMADPFVRETSHRDPRVLSAAEQDVFFRDMETLGIRRGRLRRLMDFICHGWSELLDDDPTWVRTTEEQACIELMKANLDFTRGILPCELPGLAVHTLSDHEDLRLCHVRPHVLFDDYHLVSRAHQQLACMLAGKSLTISADEVPALAVYERYPYPKGVREFRDSLDAGTIGLEYCRRPGDVVNTLNALREDACPGTAPLKAKGVPVGAHGGVRLSEFPRLVDELGGICESVCDALDAGVDPGQIVVVGTNGVWRANMASALEAAGVPVANAGRAQREACDRDALLARLLEDPDDSLAWRSWCGQGDALSRSAGIARLQELCGSNGLSLAEALCLLDMGQLGDDTDQGPLLSGILRAYRQGMDALRSAGEDCAVADGTPDANVDETSAVDKTAPGNLVSVLSPSQLYGRAADMVVFGGFVDGFIPSREYCEPGTLVGAARERAHAVNLQTVQAVVAAARHRLVVSAFTSCGLEVAERLKLRVVRIGLSDGVRTCRLEPSEMLEYVSYR